MPVHPFFGAVKNKTSLKPKTTTSSPVKKKSPKPKKAAKPKGPSLVIEKNVPKPKKTEEEKKRARQSDEEDELTVQRKRKKKKPVIADDDDDDDVEMPVVKAKKKKEKKPKKQKSAKKRKRARVLSSSEEDSSDSEDEFVPTKKSSTTKSKPVVAKAAVPPKPKVKPKVMDAGSFFGSVSVGSKKSFLKTTPPVPSPEEEGRKRKRQEQDADDASAALALQLRENDLEEARQRKAAAKVQKSKSIKQELEADWGVNMKKENKEEESQALAVKKQKTSTKTNVTKSESNPANPSGTPAKIKWFPGRVAAVARNPGSKEIPQGKSNCLAGLVFVFTGAMDSTERDQAKDLVMKYGGRTTSAISGKTSYLVKGVVDVGVSKLEKAEAKKVKIIDEDEFLELIRTRPEGGDGDSQKKGKKKGKTAAKSQLAPEPELTKTEIFKAKQAAKKAAAAAQATDSKKPAPLLSANAAKAAATLSTSPKLWVDQYKPTNLTHLIGNKTNVATLTRFLNNFQNNLKRESRMLRDRQERKDRGEKVGALKASGWLRACLISGAPGIGKTTAATLIAKTLGYEVIEFNASDIRNKASLSQTVGDLMGNRGVTEFFRAKASSTARPTKSKGKVLIMDEVDGMSGNADRGGLTELINMIKQSKTPVFCICNDASNPKMKTLKNYTEKIIWRRPTADMIRPRISEICHREGLQIEPGALAKLCEATKGDVRQILNFLQMFRKSSNKANFDSVKSVLDTGSKDFTLGAFDVANLFFRNAGGKNWINDRVNHYFVDSDILPLMTQENYLNYRPACQPGKKGEADMMEAFSSAADDIARGDHLANKIWSAQEWSLMPMHALHSCIMPGAAVAGGGSGGGRIGFPTWMGKNSTRNKKLRQMSALSHVMSLESCCQKKALVLEALPLLKHKLVFPLARQGAEGIDDVLEEMEAYGLTKDDWDVVIESGWGQVTLDSKVKAALTRKFNSEGALLKMARVDKKWKPSKMKAPKAEDDDEISDEEDEKDDTVDKMMKEIKKPKAKGKSKAKAKKKSTKKR